MRVSRYRPALRVAAVSLVVAVVFAACGSSGPSPTSGRGSGASLDPAAGSPSAPFVPSGFWPGGTVIADATPASPAPTTAATAVATGTPGRAPTATATVTARPPSPTPPAPTPPATAGAACSILPASNVWNRSVAGLPVASSSAAMVQAIGLSAYLHPDFDAIGDGIPYNIVTSGTPAYTLAFDYADESDPGPYPIPASPKIEAGSDRHLLSLDLGRCKLWELYDVRYSGASWSAGSGAVFYLRSNALRPAGWTSADAAGLPIFPGLVRYDEVLTGSINHAIRFTAPDTCGYIYPARHLTADPCSNLPPMGLRLRLKVPVDISGFGPHARIVLTALKRYGMILADNGSPWYITGVPDPRWNDDEMHLLQGLTGADFEVVDTSGLRNG